MQIFRVIVRGRFGELEPATRALLREGLGPEAELDSYAFSRDGRLAYDRRLDFFSFRVEVRVPDDAPGDAQVAAHAEAEARATAHLASRDLTWRDLRLTSTNMADVWR